MTYEVSNIVVETLLSYYRDIQKYNELISLERKDARYGVDGQIYAAFKLNRVSENTKLSFINDYCSMIKKAMKAWENHKNDKEYKAYRTVQLMYMGKKKLDNKSISEIVGCFNKNFRRDCLDKGIDIYKAYLIKQFKKLNYRVNKNYTLEYDRNLETMLYVVSNIARKSREYFKETKTSSVAKPRLHTINSQPKELKEVS